MPEQTARHIEPSTEQEQSSYLSLELWTDASGTRFWLCVHADHALCGPGAELVARIWTPVPDDTPAPASPPAGKFR